MDQVKILNSSNEQVLPVTHFNSVRDSQGNTLTSVLGAVADSVNEERAYAPSDYSGMGRIVLKKNMVSGVNTLTQAMLSATNTVYVIKYDFVLGADITVPANSVLHFEGGSITASGNNDTITGNNTGVEAGLVKIFNTNIVLDGTWSVNEAYPEWFGAKGDDNTDDTDAVQNCITYFFSTKFTKCYKTTRTITFPQYAHRNVYGIQSGAIDSGNDTKIVGIHSSADVGMLIPYDSQRFYNMNLHDFSIRGESGKSCGLRALWTSNSTFERLNIFEYRDGIGFDLSNTDSGWNGQYSTIRSCIINVCKIGIKINANGTVVEGCYIDGSNNFCEYLTPGFLVGSIGILLVGGGDCNRITNNNLQGWHIGIEIHSGNNHVVNNRFEGTACGIYIPDGTLNTIGEDNNFNNHIIANRNNVDRYGVTGYIKGSRNTVHNCVFQSMYGIQVNDGNIDETGQKFFYDLGDLDLNNETYYLTPRLDGFNANFGCQIDSVELCIQNFGDFIYGWSNFILEVNDIIFYSNAGGGAGITDGAYNVVIKNTTHRQWLSQTTNPIVLRIKTSQDLAVMKQVRLLFKVKNMVIESDAQAIINLT